jgi:hypothetical protein
MNCSGPPGATPEQIAELEARKQRFLARQAQQAGNADARRRASAGFFMSNLDVTGPYNQQLGPSEQSKKLIYVCDPAEGADAACTREILTTLTTRAYRRPAAEAEVKELIGLVEMVQRTGDSFEEGLALAIQRLLISPNFLFRIEHGTQLSGKPFEAVDDYELASRLSYYLWSSMPDDELLRLASEAGCGTMRLRPGAQIAAEPQAQALWRTRRTGLQFRAWNRSSLTRYIPAFQGIAQRWQKGRAVLRLHRQAGPPDHRLHRRRLHLPQ